MKKNINRREMIAFGKNILLTSLVAYGTIGCATSTPPLDWSRVEQSGDGLGEATVVTLNGSAMVGAGMLSTGDRIRSGDMVELAGGSDMMLEMPDRSIVKLKGKSKLNMNLDSKQGGELSLHLGSLLSVIRPRRTRSYIIKGAMAQVGVKGTVCFLQVFDDESRKIDSRIPDKATDYFCLCNGSVDFLKEGSEAVFSSETTTYHHASFLSPDSGQVALTHAGFLLNHSDTEIADLVGHMKKPRHDISWLKNYHNTSDY